MVDLLGSPRVAPVFFLAFLLYIHIFYFPRGSSCYGPRFSARFISLELPQSGSRHRRPILAREYSFSKQKRAYEQDSSLRHDPTPFFGQIPSFWPSDGRPFPFPAVVEEHLSGISCRGLRVRSYQH